MGEAGLKTRDEHRQVTNTKMYKDSMSKVTAGLAVFGDGMTMEEFPAINISK